MVKKYIWRLISCSAAMAGPIGALVSCSPDTYGLIFIIYLPYEIEVNLTEKDTLQKFAQEGDFVSFYKLVEIISRNDEINGERIEELSKSGDLKLADPIRLIPNSDGSVMIEFSFYIYKSESRSWRMSTKLVEK